MKRFIHTLSLFTLPLLFIFGSTTAYYYFAVHPHLTGDLGRLGGIPFGSAYRDSMNVCRLSENRVMEYRPGEEYRAQVVTLGDSFSQQREYGYQNFLAHATGCSVLNIEPMKDPIQAAIDLLNNGYFDTHPPQTVVVEIVGRSLPGALVWLDRKRARAIEEVVSFKKEKAEHLTTSSLVQYTYNWLMLKLEENPVCEANTTHALFTLRPQKLYFYRDDLTSLTCTDQELAQMQQSLVQLHDLFAQRGIRFVLLVAVDKYELYQPFIIQNPYPTKTTLERMAAVCDSTLYINTKRLFAPHLMQGVRDLYHANDTHWSQTGAQLVAAELARRHVASKATQGE